MRTSLDRESIRNIKSRVHDFLRRYGMHYERIEMQGMCNEFIREMDKGLKGEGSLGMLPTYIDPYINITANKQVIAIDAGGTNIRVAQVSFGIDKKPVVDYFRSYPMPGSRGEISKEEFFGTLVSYLEPIINNSDKIGFCFSYDVEILPNKDGRIRDFSKEVKVKGMKGTMIGYGLLDALEEYGYTGKKDVIVLNDTAATLLGVKFLKNDKVYDDYIGFILGTGTNTCYTEENRNIVKARDICSSEGSMLVNIESGGYAKLPLGLIDIEFIQGTSNPDHHLFEKMVSGAYQGGLMLKILRKAAEEGLFSDAAAKAIIALDSLSGRDMDDFIENPFAGKLYKKDAFSEMDSACIYFLVDAFYERVARLVTVNLASVILKTGKGANPCVPVCIAAEGSVFGKSKLFRSKLDYYVKEFMNQKNGIYCEFASSENAVIIGAGIAGLSSTVDRN